MALIYFEVLLTFVPLTPHCPWSTRERLLEQVKVDSLKSRWDGSHRLWAKIQDMPTTFNRIVVGGSTCSAYPSSEAALCAVG